MNTLSFLDGWEMQKLLLTLRRTSLQRLAELLTALGSQLTLESGALHLS